MYCCFWLGLQNEDGEHFCCLGNNVFISSCRVRNKKYLTEAREMSRHIINCINTLLVSSHNCHQTLSSHICCSPLLTTHSYLLLISASYKNNMKGWYDVSALAPLWHCTPGCRSRSSLGGEYNGFYDHDQPKQKYFMSKTIILGQESKFSKQPKQGWNKRTLAMIIWLNGEWLHFSPIFSFL